MNETKELPCQFYYPQYN